jgi:hypothetical protein
MFLRRIALLILVIVATPHHRAHTAEATRFQLRIERDIPAETPLIAELPSNVAPGSYLLQVPEGRSYAAQVFEDGGKSHIATLLPRLPGRSELICTLQPAPSTGNGGVAFQSSPERVRVEIDGQLLTEYRASDGPKPYYYPVIGPTGQPCTRAYPMAQVEGEDRDHNHQRSFWFTHGNVDGVDFWAADPLNPPRPNYGTIKETSRKVVTTGPVVGMLRTTDDWLGPDGQVLCQDERVVRFYNTRDARVLDFDIVIRATAKPVTFKDTKEGMFGLRLASSMDVKRKQGGKIINAEGITDQQAWGKASPWVDYTGPVAGETVGVAILNHPQSFRYPTTWHVRDYGLFAANPFGWSDFGLKKSGDHTIPAGGRIAFQYRIVLHKGDTATAGIPQVFDAYAQPPQLRAVTE